jgi:hypothetical protein
MVVVVLLLLVGDVHACVSRLPMQLVLSQLHSLAWHRRKAYCVHCTPCSTRQVN